MVEKKLHIEGMDRCLQRQQLGVVISGELSDFLCPTHWYICTLIVVYREIVARKSQKI